MKLVGVLATLLGAPTVILLARSLSDAVTPWRVVQGAIFALSVAGGISVLLAVSARRVALLGVSLIMCALISSRGITNEFIRRGSITTPDELMPLSEEITWQISGSIAIAYLVLAAGLAVSWYWRQRRAHLAG